MSETAGSGPERRVFALREARMLWRIRCGLVKVPGTAKTLESRRGMA
jgi:hypothetical protein